jgi:hypothetical protein
VRGRQWGGEGAAAVRTWEAKRAAVQRTGGEGKGWRWGGEGALVERSWDGGGADPQGRWWGMGTA